MKIETGNFLSHKESIPNDEKDIEEMRQKIIQRGDTEYSTVSEQLKIFEQFTSFGFGRFFILNKGLNGYWTRYLNLHHRLPKREMSELERFWLEKSPFSVASQQRFEIFQQKLQDNIKDNSSVCSVPCGLMDDLLTLDLRKFPKIKLIGIDVDEESTKLARENAIEKGLQNNCTFYTMDAWKMDFQNEFDILTSNGLNCYVHDDDMVIELYEKFYKSLKNGGLLITSMPELPKKEHLDSFDDETKQLFKRTFAIMQLIGDFSHADLSLDKTVNQLKSVGFKDFQIFFDKRKLFPTILARK